MKLTLIHIGLLIGVALAFVSFLFFGRQQNTFQILLISGLILASAFYLIILFSKSPLKTKVLWTATIILLAIVQQLTEPLFINSSYRIYISEHRKLLTEINDILMHKKDDVVILHDTIIAKTDLLTIDETAKLKKGREQLGVYQVFKFDNGIYYGLWGFLDVRLGITYLPGKTESHMQYRHLTEHWFH